jgi:hypothetical protein
MSDIVSSFTETGLSKEDALGRAWNLIAIWATRGPNMGIGNYANEKSLHVVIALDIISSAVPFLDQLSIESNQRPYSYPPQIKTTCSYGKPYHFWMAAFLANKLGKQISDGMGAMYATYLAEIGYQMRSVTQGRDPYRVFVVDAFDPYNNKMRVDIAFAAAGAIYGMQTAIGEEIRSLDIDKALIAEIKHTSTVSALPASEAGKLWTGEGVSDKGFLGKYRQKYWQSGAKGYFRWKKIIAPDAALDELLDQVSNVRPGSKYNGVVD